MAAPELLAGGVAGLPTEYFRLLWWRAADLRTHASRDTIFLFCILL